MNSPIGVVRGAANCRWPIANTELEIPKVIKSQAAKVVRVARLAEAGHFASGTV